MPKDVRVIRMDTGVTVFTYNNAEIAQFEDAFALVIPTVGVDIRRHLSFMYPTYDRIELSPVGVAYPGDGVDGNGPKKAVTRFGAYAANITFNRCDAALFMGSWFVITKGEHIVAFSARIIEYVDVQPSIP